jgi:hypothetical protein
MDTYLPVTATHDVFLSVGHIATSSLVFGGHAMAQLVEALRYKPECRGFDFRWCHWNFHLHNTSGRTMALGSTQPLTEMSTMNVSWG